MILVQLHRGTGLVSNLIRWQQRSQYAHASILVNGTVYEATAKDGVRRVGAATYEAAYRDGTIVAAPVWLTARDETRLVEFLEAQVGKPYDFLSVARFVTRRKASRNAERWFCSELVVAAFDAIDLPLFHQTEPWEVSPGLLGRTPHLDFRGYEP